MTCKGERIRTDREGLIVGLRSSRYLTCKGEGVSTYRLDNVDDAANLSNGSLAGQGE